MSDLILYTSDDGTTRVDLRVEGGTIWLTQAEIAKLFQTKKRHDTRQIASVTCRFAHFTLRREFRL